MAVLTADNTPLSKLAQAKESVEIRNEDGLLMGTYRPAEEVRWTVPRELLKQLEAKSKTHIASNDKGCTLDEMIEHPLHTGGPVFSTECHKLAFAIQISRLFNHFGIPDAVVSERQLQERQQQTHTISMSHEIVEARDE